MYVCDITDDDVCVPFGRCFFLLFTCCTLCDMCLHTCQSDSFLLKGWLLLVKQYFPLHEETVKLNIINSSFV